MAEEIAVENGRISNFEGLVTLTLYRVILHTVVHHSSTSTYTCQILLKSKKLFVDGRTHTRTDGHLRPTLSGLLRIVDLKITYCTGLHPLLVHQLMGYHNFWYIRGLSADGNLFPQRRRYHHQMMINRSSRLFRERVNSLGGLDLPKLRYFPP